MVKEKIFFKRVSRFDIVNRDIVNREEKGRSIEGRTIVVQSSSILGFMRVIILFNFMKFEC